MPARRGTIWAILALVAIPSSCGEGRKPVERPKASQDKANGARDGQAVQPERPELTAQELRFRLFPRLSPGRADLPTEPPVAGLLRFEDGVGLQIQPRIREGAYYRDATEAELRSIDTVGVPREQIYRENLARLFREASPLTVIGDPSGMRFIEFDTALAGSEALILLPELWDSVERTLGREAVLALPDRGMCRFLPAGPWSFVGEMVPTFVERHEGASAPLADTLLFRDGQRIRRGNTFESLAGR
ncbi:MAG: hypothetical protein KDC95_08480 [Planctomycetes bacterium]|nr:hypothetical protein [Planctomycetota bacterium]